jgi:hypothetical protein
MPDPSSYNLQPNFPIAGVADLLAKKPFEEAQMRAQQQQQLVQGLQAFGQGVDSLTQRRLAMAQALAGAKILGNTPEGQQMLGTNQVASVSPNNTPVTANQTAQGGVGVSPVPNKSPVDMNTLATAFYGDKPSELLNQLYERQKQRQQFGLESQKEAFTERIEPQKLAAEQAIQKLLAGIKGKEATTQATHTADEDTNALLQRRAELTKSLPTGWWSSINNVQAEQAKKEISDIDSALAKKGYTGSISNTSQGSQGGGGGKVTTVNGTTYSIND